MSRGGPGSDAPRSRSMGTSEPRILADPVLDVGELGSFDDAGVTKPMCRRPRGPTYLYYSGWTRGVSVPFYFFIGCAVSDGGPFVRVSPAPILEAVARSTHTSPRRPGCWSRTAVGGCGTSPGRGGASRTGGRSTGTTSSTPSPTTASNGAGRFGLHRLPRRVSTPSHGHASCAKSGYRMWYCARGGGRTGSGTPSRRTASAGRGATTKR